MLSPNAARSLRVLLVPLLTASVTAACADDSPPIAPASAAVPARVLPPVIPAPSASPASESPTPTIDVGGRVVDDREQPIVGRPIVVVDSVGKRMEILTDEEGGFWAMGVAPPYDLLVTQAPSGAVITPHVVLGLRRDDPRIEVFEREGDTERPASQPLRVGVNLPPCPAAWGACWVSVVSTSASGRGGTATSYTEGAQTSILEIDHAFQEPSLRRGESIDVHVLVGDAQYTQYAYARAGHVAARPGEPMDLGMVTPAPIAAGPRVTIAGQAGPLPDGSLWTLTTELELLDGAAIPLRFDWAPTTALRLPLVAGATWRVGAWAQSPPADDRPYFHRSSQAWSGTLPLTAENVAIEVPGAPEPTRPALEGTFSRRGPRFAWSAGAPGLASLALVDLARGRQRFRALTSESAVDLRRLEALGLARLEAGDHVFDLTTTPGAGVDELTQPDARLRRGRFDTHVPGSTTYQRFRFQVTP